MPAFSRRVLNDVHECGDTLDAGVYVPPESADAPRRVQVLLTDKRAAAGESCPRRPLLLQVAFDDAYPMVPPIMQFSSLVDDPLVAENGCVDASFIGAWVPCLRLKTVLLALQGSLMQAFSAIPSCNSDEKPSRSQTLAPQDTPDLLLLLLRAAFEARSLPEGWRYLNGLRGLIATLPPTLQLQAPAWRELRALLHAPPGCCVKGSIGVDPRWMSEAVLLRRLLRPLLNEWTSFKMLTTAYDSGRSIGHLDHCWLHVRTFLPDAEDLRQEAEFNDEPPSPTWLRPRLLALRACSGRKVGGCGPLYGDQAGREPRLAAPLGGG